MRVIKYDLETIKEIFDELDGNSEGSFEDWLDRAESHLEEIRKLDSSLRGKYWSTNNIWSELYPALSKLSGHKCWYSEAPENSSEWEIEHFRPKGNSKSENGVMLREDGYWWLSYSWHNYRLSGSLVNRLRKDRFNEDNSVYGKGNFFPLNTKEIAQPEDEFCECESPLLLDPLKPRDVTLISFDKNGQPYPTYKHEENTLYYKKAQLSIKFYGLDHTPLSRGRRKVWLKCEQLVKRAHNYIVNNINDPERRENRIDECYLKLSEYSDKNQPYSMVVRNFVKEKLKDDNYSWLSDVERVLI